MGGGSLKNWHELSFVGVALRSGAVLLACVAQGLLAACMAAGPLGSDPFQRQRDELVARDLIPAGITNPRVIQAIRRTPRHEFVSPSQRKNAYFDMALPIGSGQTISPPYIVAFMTQKLDPQPRDRVLEIGTGSGYQAAVLSHLVDQVYSIEIVEALGRQAKLTLLRLGYTNVHTKIGDGFQGWQEHAPFDKIIVTCSPENIPQPLVDQLVEGGRIVVPLGDRFQQTLYLFVKENGKLRRTALEATFFVPMTGQAEAQREGAVNERVPRLRHTGFEERFADTDQPEGWYYARQAEVVADPQAPEGAHVVAIRNETPGRMGHLVQSFGVDGRVVRSMSLELMVRGNDVAIGAHPDEAPGVFLEFYGESRAPVGRVRLGPWTGTFGWRKETHRIVVPANARLAVVALGLFGGTGTICFDGIVLTPTQVIESNEAAHGNPA